MLVNGERIRILIDEAGLSQNDVGRLIGKSPACICKVIKDGRASKGTVNDLCKVLRVTEDVITSIPDEEPKEDTQTLLSSIHMLHRRMCDLERQMAEMTEALTALKSVWE